MCGELVTTTVSAEILPHRCLCFLIHAGASLTQTHTTPHPPPLLVLSYLSCPGISAFNGLKQTRAQKKQGKQFKEMWQMMQSAQRAFTFDRVFTFQVFRDCLCFCRRVAVLNGCRAVLWLQLWFTCLGQLFVLESGLSAEQWRRPAVGSLSAKPACFANYQRGNLYSCAPDNGATVVGVFKSLWFFSQSFVCVRRCSISSLFSFSCVQGHVEQQG